MKTLARQQETTRLLQERIETARSVIMRALEKEGGELRAQRLWDYIASEGAEVDRDDVDVAVAQMATEKLISRTPFGLRLIS